MDIPDLDVFQVVADPTRRKILEILTEGPHTINALAENFDISRPAVSKHIWILEDTGFINITKEGRERHCSLHTDGFLEVQRWLSFFTDFWRTKINNS
ncbi:metalloregulator ArsR/SmtB family transcription factor [Gracilimonas sp.]|uniref:ArsR/SmtB family transcription factor n=1 Tax=Gracilimonas sp. TaxID=1974203 RepID=UPI0032EE4BEA